MKRHGSSAAHIVWKSIQTLVTACFQCLYSILVLLLLSLTAFAAYVATLDDIPVPGFLIREIRTSLESKGILLQVEGMRLKPTGLISLEQPRIHSTELDATIVSADDAVARIKLSQLLLGKVAVDQVKVSNGRVFIPALFTRSGLPETAVDSIDMEVEIGRNLIEIRYANASVHNLDVSLSGPLKQRLVRERLTSAPTGPPPTVTETILKLAPKIEALKTQLEKLSSPKCIIKLDVDQSSQQTAELDILIDRIKARPDVTVYGAFAHGHYHQEEGIKLRFALDQLDLPDGVTVTQALAQTAWPAIPSSTSFFPERIDASLGNTELRGLSLHAMVTRLLPGTDQHRWRLQLAFGDTPIDFLARFDTASETLDFDLKAQLGPGLPAILEPLTQQIAGINTIEIATLDESIDIVARGFLDSDFKPTLIRASAQAGPTEVLGAKIDRATLSGQMIGEQIDVENVWLRSGLQSAHIQIRYNLKSLFRRILVEGSVDPTMINGWFLPWWAGIWEGMEFPAEGMYTAMDSQAYFKQPDTVRVSGIAHGHGLNLRGLQTDELRMRYFSLFHYVDLYDIELTTPEERFARGEIQFTMGRDSRDARDKLTGMWIDAETNLDVHRGPELLWEISDAVAEIVEPYTYTIPPRIKARSQSIRRQDLFDYNIDLDIHTENEFSYYGFPFQSLDTFVHLENDIADIPNARGKLGDGLIEVMAFIRGEDIHLDVNLQDAHFGKTLVASNTYFAIGGSEHAQNMDTDRLLNYGGTLNTRFTGDGIVGDSLSYEGSGDFHIEDADFGKYQILGVLSQILESTPLGFTTLSFNDAKGDFRVDKRLVRFDEAEIDGPVAALILDGSYNIETDALDFNANLFPFRNSKIPLISPILNVALQPVSSVLQFVVKGTFKEPKLSLFDQDAERGEPTTIIDPRSNRPVRP